MVEEFFASTLSYSADQFEIHAVDITQRLQQLDPSAEDFVSVLPVKKCDFIFTCNRVAIVDV